MRETNEQGKQIIDQILSEKKGREKYVDNYIINQRESTRERGRRGREGGECEREGKR